jgi:hypothetical protein
LQRREELLADFPTAFLEHNLIPASRAAVTRIYSNWLLYLRARKADRRPTQATLPRQRAVAPQPVPGIG